MSPGVQQSCPNLPNRPFLRLSAQWLGLCMAARLQVTLLWWRPNCFCWANQIVLMLTICIQTRKAKSSVLKSGHFQPRLHPRARWKPAIRRPCVFSPRESSFPLQKKKVAWSQVSQVTKHRTVKWSITRVCFDSLLPYYFALNYSYIT